MTDRGKNMSETDTCDRGIDVVSYLHCQMSADERTLFENHLKKCASCMENAAAFRNVIGKLEQVPVEPPIRDLAPKIIARIPQREWTRSPSSGTFMFLFRLAAVFLCAAGVGLLALHLLTSRQAGTTATATITQERWKQTAPAKIQVVEADEKKQAVAAALKWLASAQEPDGSWDAAKWGAEQQYTVGITALSLLAFIGSDRHVLECPNSDTVRRGLNYLMARQNEQGRFGPECKRADVQSRHRHAGASRCICLEERRFIQESDWPGHPIYVQAAKRSRQLGIRAERRQVAQHFRDGVAVASSHSG